MATIDVEVELDEFSDDEICWYVKHHKELLSSLLPLLDDNELAKECSNRGIGCSWPEKTSLRDEFYDEVFQKLKEKYTVEELEKLI